MIEVSAVCSTVLLSFRCLSWLIIIGMKAVCRFWNTYTHLWEVKSFWLKLLSVIPALGETYFTSPTILLIRIFHIVWIWNIESIPFLSLYKSSFCAGSQGWKCIVWMMCNGYNTILVRILIFNFILLSICHNSWNSWKKAKGCSKVMMDLTKNLFYNLIIL